MAASEGGRAAGASWAWAIARDPRALWFLGLVCPQAFVYPVLRQLRSAAPFAYESYFWGEAAFLVLAGVLSLWLGHRPARTGQGRAARGFLPWWVALTGCLGVATVFFCPGADLWVQLGAVLCGCARMACFYQCFVLLSQVRPLARYGFVAVGFALAPLLRLPMMELPLPVPLLCAVLGLLPMACFGMCARARVALPAMETLALVGGPPARLAARSLMPYGINLFLFGIALGCVNVPMEPDSLAGGAAVAVTLLKVLLPLALLAFIYGCRRVVSVGHLFQIVLAVVLLATSAILGLGDAYEGLPVVASDLAFYLMVMLLYLVLASLADRSPVRAGLLFCAGWLPYALSSALGMTLAAAFGALSHGPRLLLVYGLCAAAALATLVVSMRGSADDLMFYGTAARASQLAEQSIEERCAALAERYRLSPREVEIMGYICRSYSKSYIAERLGISQNTVRTHAKALYTKLDVHSRDELLAVVDGVAKEV